MLCRSEVISRLIPTQFRWVFIRVIPHKFIKCIIATDGRLDKKKKILVNECAKWEKKKENSWRHCVVKPKSLAISQCAECNASVSSQLRRVSGSAPNKCNVNLQFLINKAFRRLSDLCWNPSFLERASNILKIFKWHFRFSWIVFKIYYFFAPLYLKSNFCLTCLTGCYFILNIFLLNTSAWHQRIFFPSTSVVLLSNSASIKRWFSSPAVAMYPLIY